MKRYRFALNSILRARRAEEDMARQRLAAANHEVRAARAAYEARRAELGAVPWADAPVDPVVFRANRAHEERMAAVLAKARQVVAVAEVAAASCYSAWVEAGKQVASLERLDERRRAEWNAEFLRQEAIAVDDVVAARFVAALAALEATSGRVA